MCTSRLHKVRQVESGVAADVEDLDGHTHRVSLLALDGPDPEAGDWLVVHSGYAIDRVERDEAEVVAEEVRRATRTVRS